MSASILADLLEKAACGACPVVVAALATASTEPLSAPLPACIRSKEDHEK